MIKISPLKPHLINKIRENPLKQGIVLQHALVDDIMVYSESQLAEMYNGIYKSKKIIKVDDGSFIELSNIIEVLCDCENVLMSSRYLTVNEYKQFIFKVKHIKTFHVNDYYLVTKGKRNERKMHKITDWLCKVGGFQKSKFKNKTTFSIPNYFDSMLEFESIKIPKALYEPINLYINNMFFNQDDYISDFKVLSKLKFED
jgi:hypothetical protein